MPNLLPCSQGWDPYVLSCSPNTPTGQERLTPRRGQVSHSPVSPVQPVLSSQVAKAYPYSHRRQTIGLTGPDLLISCLDTRLSHQRATHFNPFQHEFPETSLGGTALWDSTASPPEIYPTSYWDSRMLPHPRIACSDDTDLLFQCGPAQTT